MTTSSYLKAAVAAAVVYFAGDFLWHEVLLHNFYYSRLDVINAGATGAADPRFMPLVEIVAALISTRFILMTSSTPGQAAWNSMLLGLLMGCAVNFVNHSLIIGWDLKVVLIDVVWSAGLGLISGPVIFWVGGKRA